MARKILLADDSVTAQNMGRKILADAGYDVVTVNNGSAALKRVAEIRPDLIVLDVYMPGYSGLEVCQRLKEAEETAHIPVLLTVGKLEPFKAEEGRRVRADSHIVKPFEASELLSAITRLEDHIVPHQAAGGERSRSKGNQRQDGNSESDTGWKSRLSFSSKKKKEEPEPGPEETAAGASFRDFRKTKGKPGVSAPVAAKTASPASQEPAAAQETAAVLSSDVAHDIASSIASRVANDVPCDVPRDITSEELDALSALASKLNPSIPEAALATNSATEFAIERPADTGIAGEAEASSEAIEAPRNEVETPALRVDYVAPQAVESDATVADTIVEPLEAKTEVEIPVQCVELAVENPEAVAAGPVAAESVSAEFQTSEESLSQPADGNQFSGPPVLMEVNAALLAEEAAPVDKNDEPTFASAASSIEGTAAEIEDKPLETVAVGEKTENAASTDKTENTDDTANVYNAHVETSASEAVIVAPAAESERFEPAAASTALPETAMRQEAEEAVPSDAELVEALRLLTPSCTSDIFTVPSPNLMAAAGQILVEQARLEAMAGPRWVAEPMTLTPEEASMSLEAEMAQTFGAQSFGAQSFGAQTFATSPATEGGERVDSGWSSGVSAIAAAVDNRLAEANLIAGAKRESGENGPDASLEAPVPNAAEASTIATAGDALNTVPAAESTSATGTAPEREAEETPKARAAAAAAEGSASASASATATDASTIASIVDSVMADLRPRIMEEIARKLAKKD